MTKIRVLIFLLTIVVVGTLGTIVSLYARGYRFDTKALKFRPNGLLVVESEPTGAQIFINGELETASDATISLAPGIYDVEIRKDGYLTWSKRLTIEKEVVTEAIVNLFKSTPSLTPLTFTGSISPVVAADYTKIAFVVPVSLEPGEADKAGIWILETTNLPLGFARDPRQITDGDFTQATMQFSPDSRELLVTTSQGVYLLDTGSFTPQARHVNVASRKNLILDGWLEEENKRFEAQIKNLPEELSELLQRYSSAVSFSPDENKILYTASSSATLPPNLIKQLPGSSTQRQERNVEPGKTYIYDIKEDRNFMITDTSANLNSVEATLSWFPTSRHLIFAEEGKITIMDYDGTNRLAVYSGSYVTPYAYSFLNSSKLVILTNLGSESSLTNLYTLSLK